MTISTQEQVLVKKFRDWIKSQPQFVSPRTDDLFILRFLRFRKFNFDESCRVFEKYLKVRNVHPYCYKNLNIRDTSLYDLMKRGYIFPLFERDDRGRTVIFGRCAMFNQKFGHLPTDLFRSIIITFEILLDNEDNQKNGFVYIFDQEGVCLSEVTYLGIRELKRLAQSGEKALPVKHKQVHWINLPHLIRTILIFISGFMTQKLQNRLSFPRDLNELHKRIPVDILPKEYGGSVPWRVMADKWIKTVEENREKLMALDSMTLDENRKKEKRSKKNKIY
ncbi:alpha-tocopherol transfer protein-like [Panonychus citri]|uniref:alpha-tocopherol transfer protein-like n=1 Tax=Panonychus citri TaxID=50023 RepID=UPI0023078BC5|nr:alpha-tocopherol transfer protein-like [Panonychus citri]